MNKPTSPLDPNPIAYLTGEDLGNVKFPSSSHLMAVPPIRHLVAKRRWEVFQQSGAQLQVWSDTHTGVSQGVAEYNVKGIINSIDSLNSLERSELVLRPVMAIDRIYSYRSLSAFPNVRFLLIGSRTEYEVLATHGYGVDIRMIEALDLVSYSPWIKAGDMHALPYESNYFDVVIMGWVLAYSSKPEVVANEVVRVLKPGGIVSIGQDAYSEDMNEKMEFKIDNRPRDAASLMKTFGDSVNDVYFKHDPNYPANDIEGFIGHVISVFDIKK